MSKLVLIGGPPGIGKSTVLRLLEKQLNHAGLLDADDVWRVSEQLATGAGRHIALTNVISVMEGYFHAGCETGILSWVFARPELYEPVIKGLEKVVESVTQVYLIATPEVLEARLRHRPESGNDNHLIEKRIAYSRSRLELIEALPFPKIDTSRISPTEVAGRIVTLINA